MNLKNLVVHESHKKTRKYLNVYRDFAGHPFSDLLLQDIMLIYFVNFVFFVDQKRFLG